MQQNSFIAQSNVFLVSENGFKDSFFCQNFSSVQKQYIRIILKTVSALKRWIAF